MRSKSVATGRWGLRPIGDRVAIAVPSNANQARKRMERRIIHLLYTAMAPDSSVHDGVACAGCEVEAIGHDAALLAWIKRPLRQPAASDDPLPILASGCSFALNPTGNPTIRALIFTLLLILPVPAALAQQLAGYTQMINDGRHGTQIEYLTEGGKAFLWYPDNSNILEGR